MPATLSTWTRLAPVTLREAKIRSGISGLARRVLPDDEPGEQGDEPAPKREGLTGQPAVLAAGLTMV